MVATRGGFAWRGGRCAKRAFIKPGGVEISAAAHAEHGCFHGLSRGGRFAGTVEGAACAKRAVKHGRLDVRIRARANFRRLWGEVAIGGEILEPCAASRGDG